VQFNQVGKYQVGKTIGEGTFGKVKLAVNTETGEKMAIKVRTSLLLLLLMVFECLLWVFCRFRSKRASNH